MATSNTRYRPDWGGSVQVPEVGELLLAFSDRMAKQQESGVNQAMKQQMMDEEKRQYDLALGFKQRAEDREVAKESKDRLKEQFQADAVSAALDPSRFKESKLAGERSALEASIAGLPQTEREAILKQYDPVVSGNQWVSSTLASPYVNQADLVKAKSADMEIKLKDPNSAEFKALQEAEFENKRRLVEMQANAEKDLAGYKAAVSGKSSGGLSGIDAKKFQKLEDKREEAAILGIEVSPEDSAIGLEYKIQNYKTNADKATKIKDEQALAEAKAVKERGNLLGFDAKSGITGYDEYVANVNPDVGKGDFFGRSNDRLLNKMLTDQQTVMGLQKRGVGAKELTELIEKRTASGAKRGEDFEDVLEAISKQYRNDGETFDTSYSPLR